MATKEKERLPPSLVRLFEPTDGFRGSFGWLCGYSADARFLDLASECFTGLTLAQRARQGAVSLVAMLDPGCPQIAPTEVPGLLHVPFKDDANRFFNLLHAKVAVLLFRAEDRSGAWRVRMIVSTGNWTSQTLEQSLDLAWHVDVEGPKPSNGSEDVLGDINAAWSLLKDVRKLFELGTLTPISSRESTTMQAMSMFDEVLEGIAQRASRKCRHFFDNRTKSLVSQLVACVDKVSEPKARNYLAMGSGFFESAIPEGELPLALKEIVSALSSTKKKRLTDSAQIDVFVNPCACQAVASASASMTREGWAVRAAQQPESFPQPERSLHAKFIFSANRRPSEGARSNYSSAWLYLGSGNLTSPGFIQAAARNKGNLEAGIVTRVDGLTGQSLPKLLPIRPDGKEISLQDLEPGEPMEDLPQSFFSAPVPYLECRPDGEIGLICIPEGTQGAMAFDVLDANDVPCPLDADGHFIWTGPAPRQVRLSWMEDDQNRQSIVPIVDQYGRVGALPLTELDLESAWSQLFSFPVMPADDELDAVEFDERGIANDVRQGIDGMSSAYPIRKVMSLVENIATMQVELSPLDWPSWCIRLGQTLEQASTCQAVTYCRRLGVNVLSPLWEEGFRPDFSFEARHKTRYELALQTVERAWGIDKLQRIGDRP